MKRWIDIKNAQAVDNSSIPIIDISELAGDITKYVKKGLRVVQFFCREIEDGKKQLITAVLADDETSLLKLSQSALKTNGRYGSITPTAEAMHIFEREVHEQTGIIPSGHPWLKAVRCEHSKTNSAGEMKDYPYLDIIGEQTHEVAVGPVHAGIIEPGSFRFLCHGEQVYHLEIQLGYQHRGVERLFKQGSAVRKWHLAESIVGDSVIAHGLAYCCAVEALSDTETPKRAELIRCLALELERIAMHLVGLGGISLDIGFLLGASVYGRLRTSVINTMLQICGCRFGRGLIRPGGVLFDISDDLRRVIRRSLDTLENDIVKINDLFFNSPSVLSRLERTGVIDTEIAKKIGLVGIMAKMAGIPNDSRKTHQLGLYKTENIAPITLTTGDAFARAKIRALEIEQSINLIRKWLNYTKIKTPIITAPKRLKSNHSAVTVTEGWRGEVCHFAVTGNTNAFEYYKIKDPSFHNWTGLALALRGNGISDFPLCNKSFDLSYCGFDL
ncbi:formate hydrogenase HycE [Candidatus Magnetoovum chiemensis]|nr:formate hydrogenase HycE [Candidatus Magnetoovum chiemensis]